MRFVFATIALVAAVAAQAQTAAPDAGEWTRERISAVYASAIQTAVVRNWNRPQSVPLGHRCQVAILQLPGGQVIKVDVLPDCPYDEAGKRSVQAAVLKAQPLPYAGFESVFQRRIVFAFVARD